jgi:hypothetical protein
VVVFRSTAEELLLHAADLPFAVIADPHKRLYAEFGVESSPRALLDPRAWAPIIRGVFQSFVATVRGEGQAPASNPEGGRLGLPADLLIGSEWDADRSHLHDALRPIQRPLLSRVGTTAALVMRPPKL